MRINRITIVLALVLLGMLPGLAQAQSWYSPAGWLYRKSITIDHTKVGTGPHANYPVLISRADTDLITDAQSTGNDILFTSSDGTTKLDHQIESYTSASGTIVAWVEIPSLSSTADTVIYMYYGNAGAVDQENVTGTWDGTFKAVWHLNGVFTDSTSNAANGTNSGTTGAAGKISNGRVFSRAVPAFISVTGLLGNSANVTLSAWANLNSRDTTAVHVISIGDYATIGMDDVSSGTMGTYQNASNVWTLTKVTPAAYYATTGWHYLVYSIDDTGNAQVLYVDGISKATSAITNSILYSGQGANTFIGKHANGSGNFDFDGTIDEVRVSSSVRSAGWVLTEFNNQNSPSTFITTGSEVATTTKIFTGTGNFSDATHWTFGTVPVAGEDLVIDGACTVDNNGGTDNVAYGTLTIGTGTGRTLNWAASGTNRLNVTNVSAGAGASTLSMTNGGTLIIRGTWTSTNLNFTPGAGTIDVRSTLTLPAAYAIYNNLTVNGSGITVTVAVGTTANGNLTVTSGTFTVGAFSLAVTGTATITSTMTITSATGAKSFGNLVINGTFTNTAAVVPISIAGNLQNNGTFSQGTGRVTFTGATSNTITGTAAITAFGGGITVNKGTANTNVLDVQCVITLLDGGLTLTNGTFKLTSASTIIPFLADIATAPYLVPSTTGLWCNGGTISPAATNWSMDGLLRVTSGAVTVGNAANHILGPKPNSSIIIEGGNLTITGRVSNPGFPWTFNMTGGVMTVNTMGTTTAARAPFYLDQSSSSFTMSGGTIVIERSGGSAGENLGFYSLATSGGGFTGGTLQIGNGSTPASQVIGITSTNPVYNLTVNSSNVTAQITTSALTVANNVTITAGGLNANNLGLTIGGNWTNNAATSAFTGGTATVTLNGAAASSIGGSFATTFNDLTVAKSNTVTANVNSSVTSNLLVSSGTLDLGSFTANRFSAGGTLTVSNGAALKIGGTNTLPANYSAHSIGATSTIEYGGTNQAVAILNSAQDYGHLTISGSGTKTLTGAVSVGGTLLFTNGTITTGVYDLQLKPAGSVTRVSGHVIGNFKKNVATGATIRTFEVGDATNYTPVTVTFVNVTTAGNLTVRTDPGDHANIGSSTIIPTTTANRIWTFTNGGTVFTSYGAIFTFVTGDLDVSATPGAFVVGKYTGGVWSYPTMGTKTGTTTEATGLTGFGGFQLGEVGATYNISGTVFEDLNYGGGVGRSLASSSGIARPSARVELYDSAGNFQTFATTDGAGSYTFTGLVAGTYTVRVVNVSVSPSRGAMPTTTSTQTFRTDASGGAAVAVTDHVGGQTPGFVDAFDGSTTLAALTTGTSTPQSITTVVLSSANISGIDFGYNFNVIVNANNSGQGSLRRFLLYANTMSNTGLAQSGLPAGIDNAIFMLADGTARPGLTASYPSQFVSGVATVNLASAFATITDPINLNATLQPGYAGVPMIELNGAGAGAGITGLTITAGGSTVRGFVINRFTVDGVSLSTAGSNTITGNYLGMNAAGTAASANGSAGIKINSAGNTIGGTAAANRNLISGNTANGITIDGGTGNSIIGNYIGVDVGGTSAVTNIGHGIYVLNGATGNTIGGTAANAGNLISGNGGKGVVIAAGTTNAILSNSIYSNIGIGIDLADDGVTANNGTVSGALANSGLDHPVFTTAGLNGTALNLTGYVGTAPSQTAFAGATVQVFKSDLDATGFGEGRAFLGTVTADANGNFSGTLTVGGLAVGDKITGTATDPANNTSEFGANATVAPSSKTWDGGAATNNWGDAANWNTDGVPVATDNVDLTGADTININVAAVTNHLVLNNAALTLTVNSGNSLTVSGNLTLTTGTLNTASAFPTVTGTVNVAGGIVGFTSTGAQTIPAYNYNDLTSSSTGGRTLAASGTIGVAGTFTPGTNTYTTTGSTVNYNKAGAQLVVTFNYNDLALSNSGLKTFGTGTSGIKGALTFGGTATANTTTNSATISYNGSANQTVASLTYYGLTIASTGGVVTGINTPVTNFTISSGTLDLNTSTLTITGPATYTAGTINNGTITSTGSSSTFNGTVFGAAVNATSNGLYLNGSTFNNTANFTKNGATTTISTGGNIYQGATTISNTGSASFDLGDTLPETFSANLTVNNTSTGRVQIGISSVGNLFNGNVTINHGGNTAGINTVIARNAGATATFNGNLILNNTNTNVTSGIVLANDGQATINGNVTVSSTNGRGIFFGAANGTVTLTAGHTISDAGAGTFTAGTLSLSRFTQTGSTAQTIALTGTANLTIGTTSLFGGAVTFSAPQVLLNGVQFNGAAAITKTSTIDNLSTGANIFNGTTTITNSGAGAMRLASVTKDDFNGDVTFIQTGSGLLQPAWLGDNTFAKNISTTGTTTAIVFGSGTSTVTLDGSVAQSVTGSLAPTFLNFAVANTGNTVSPGVNLSVRGNLSVSNGILDLGSFTANRTTSGGTMTVANGATLRIGGTNSIPTNYSAHSIGISGTIEYGGTTQTIAVLNSVQDYGGLKVSGSGTKTLAGNVNVAGTLTFAGVPITTGASSLYLKSAGTVVRSSTGHVIGNFKKQIVTGATSKTFEIGDATNYTPVTVAFANVTGAGDLTATTVAGDHANIGSSTIIPTESANRVWILTNTGTAFTTYDATFTFAAADVDGGANTSLFIAGRYSFGWTYPTVGTKTSTSTQTTGLTAFGDFQMGVRVAYPPNVTLLNSVTPLGTQAPNTDLTYTVAFTNDGGLPAQVFLITDPIPANTDFKLGSANTMLGSTGMTAIITYSANGGSSFFYTPVSGGGTAPAGYDSTVTNIRWTFTSNLSQTSPNNAGSVSFVVRVR
jgi:hypothetical protein